MAAFRGVIVSNSRKSIFFWRGLTAGLALLAAGSAYASNSAIVDTSYVVEAVKRNAIIWDTRSAALYRQGHIPGAVNIDDVGQVLRDENREDYFPVERYEKILGAGGIDPSKEIVVYGLKANPYPYFALVTLQWLNAANAKVYHGGIDDWKSAGHAVATEATQLAPVTLALKARPDLLVDTAEVVKKQFAGEGVEAICVQLAPRIRDDLHDDRQGLAVG